ncbi:hypothetical protein ASC84_12420 [Acinetobacter sp. Root1280]|uniref:hypothetical protein n=1 Tax=Acinetobacter sp. Root1280 TaxID=1736444 RepID=UPI0006F6B916|nr:hypothetical protein [Acinetobacter sp. Root1280]KQW88175.1 hypothetical protein ASC84_12420 [Acinetobacter sp. Root1280]
MDKFEEYIKARYPVDYEHLKEKYPNVPVGEFYGDEKDLWNYRQAEVDELRKSFDSSQNLSNLRARTIDSFKEKISDLESKLEEKDKRIEAALNHLNDVRNKGMDQSCYLAIKALRGEHE